MAQKEGWRLLSKRNILGAVLVAGIGVGLYLGDIWKGFGGGTSIGIGVGDSTSQGTGDGTGDGTKQVTKPVNVEATEDAPPEVTAAAPSPVTHVLKIVIADRSYFLRSPEGDQPVELKDLVAQAKAATGDEDGIRVRVYRKLTSRPAVEIALNDALVAAGLNEDQIVWVANPID